MSKVIRDLVPKEDSGAGLDCSHDGLTKQEFAESCDINVIVSRFLKTGQMPGNARGPGLFQDVSSVPDFRTMFSRVQEARDRFMSLPALVRRRFDNDPAQLLEFVSDAKNLDEAVELGLVDRPAGSKPAEKPAPVPAPAPVVVPPAAA